MGAMFRFKTKDITFSTREGKIVISINVGFPDDLKLTLDEPLARTFADGIQKALRELNRKGRQSEEPR